MSVKEKLIKFFYLKKNRAIFVFPPLGLLVITWFLFVFEYLFNFGIDQRFFLILLLVGALTEVFVCLLIFYTDTLRISEIMKNNHQIFF